MLEAAANGGLTGMPFRVLSISYDHTLLHVREELLKREGYEVVSAEGFVNALKRCHEGNYDLVAMGHSIPFSDKRALLEAITRDCPVPVISLIREGDPDLEGAAAHVDPFQPQEFIRITRSLLVPKTRA